MDATTTDSHKLDTEKDTDINLMHSGLPHHTQSSVDLSNAYSVKNILYHKNKYYFIISISI